jgi:CO/xanthine dehydrogenase Mo-binding subunit
VAASPLANGGAFGGKATSLAPVVARALADTLGRSVRVVYSREDTVRLGRKRPPVAAVAWRDGDVVRVRGVIAGEAPPAGAVAHPVAVDAQWTVVTVPGPLVGPARAAGWAEEAVLVAAVLDEPEVHVVGPAGATAVARVDVDPATGIVTGIVVRVDAGDPLDRVVLRSYCIGAAHMALGWVCTEGLAVDPDSGDVLDLTIRSFGIVRPAKMPPVEVTIVDGGGAARAGGSDAVFAAVAAATWNALTRAEGVRPEAWPARDTRAARALRR